MCWVVCKFCVCYGASFVFVFGGGGGNEIFEVPFWYWMLTQDRVMWANNTHCFHPDTRLGLLVGGHVPQQLTDTPPSHNMGTSPPTRVGRLATRLGCLTQENYSDNSGTCHNKSGTSGKHNTLTQGWDMSQQDWDVSQAPYTRTQDWDISQQDWDVSHNKNTLPQHWDILQQVWDVSQDNSLHFHPHTTLGHLAQQLTVTPPSHNTGTSRTTSLSHLCQEHLSPKEYLQVL